VLDRASRKEASEHFDTLNLNIPALRSAASKNKLRKRIGHNMRSGMHDGRPSTFACHRYDWRWANSRFAIADRALSAKLCWACSGRAGRLPDGAVTRNQQVRKAMELLAPPPDRRAECQHDIAVALDRVEHRAAAARSFQVGVSKKGKADVGRYLAALRRLQQAYNSIDPAIKPWFSPVEIAIPGQATVLDREIAKAESFLDRPSPPPRREASRNKAAVAAAYDLLQWWGQKAARTRGGKWAQLAKILAGDPTVDQFDHLREFKRSPGPAVEKVRGADWIVYRTRRRQPSTK
jgi:hypothetical protein